MRVGAGVAVWGDGTDGSDGSQGPHWPLGIKITSECEVFTDTLVDGGTVVGCRPTFRAATRESRDPR